MNVEGIREQFLALRDCRGVQEDGNLELLNASFVASEPTIFGTPDEDYIARELAWYQTQSRSIWDMQPPIPKIWKDIADPEGKINSNYGWCVFSQENEGQFAWALQQLRTDRHSRRAVMVYTRPTIHAHTTSMGGGDFICTNTVQLLIRHNLMLMFVQMRSNDAVFGYKNDWAWHKYVLDFAVSVYNDSYNVKEERVRPVSAGQIFWHATSLHVYPRHFQLIDLWAGERDAQREVDSYGPSA